MTELWGTLQSKELDWCTLTWKVCLHWFRYNEHQLMARSATPKQELNTRRSVWCFTVSKAALRSSNVRVQTLQSIAPVDHSANLILDGNDCGLGRILNDMLCRLIGCWLKMLVLLLRSYKYPAMDIRPLLPECHGSETIFNWSRRF